MIIKLEVQDAAVSHQIAAKAARADWIRLLKRCTFDSGMVDVENLVARLDLKIPLDDEGANRIED